MGGAALGPSLGNQALSLTQCPPLLAPLPPPLVGFGQVHGATVLARKPKKLRKICAALDLSVPDRELNHSVRFWARHPFPSCSPPPPHSGRAAGTQDGRLALRAIMRRWLPVSQGTLGAVVRRLPGAVEAQAARVERVRGCAPPF